MTTPKQRHSHDEWTRTTEDVDLEVAQLAIMCHIRLLEPGVIQRVLDNDLSLCRDGHERGFEQLRGMLYLHYEVHRQLAEELGPADAAEVVARVRADLLQRIGHQLGTPANDLSPGERGASGPGSGSPPHG